MSNDERLLKLDFICETGELIASYGLAIAAAAAAERIDILEMALRQARSVLIEGITEFKALSPNKGGAEND